MDEAAIREIRAHFPALARTWQAKPVVYLDGPAGSQVPEQVIEAVSAYLAHTNANTHGPFLTSEATDRILEDARGAVADLLGSDAPELVVFGPNMTTLTFALSHAMARTWSAGDEVVVTRLDHDANITPWVLAARDAGATVRHVPFRHDDTTLKLDALREALSERTRLVAVGAASNATGTVNPIQTICEAAHSVGAQVFVDAVHYAPHALMDVAEWGCDFVACSAYKFFGPHVGILWGRAEPMHALPAYQVRPAGNAMPGRWMTGTQNHEGIAGTLAAVEYLADLGRRLEPSCADRRAALAAAFARIGDHERTLCDRLLAGLQDIASVRIYGITDPSRAAERTPTVSFTHARLTPKQVAERLAAKGLFVWHGNYYALAVTEALGLEPEGMVRVGLLHYNTPSEVDRLLAEIRALES